jgi:predicted nucleotidyltransferase
MTLLQEMEGERLRERERLRQEVRHQLHVALAEFVPSLTTIVFGSLTRLGRFTEHSDVDLALEAEPARMSCYQLASLLSERLGRAVDIVLLPECRFRNKILREGETWTPPD